MSDRCAGGVKLKPGKRCSVCDAGPGDQCAKASLRDFEERQAMIRALEFIRDGYDNQDVSHVDYRVKVYQVALDALAKVNGGPVGEPPPSQPEQESASASVGVLREDYTCYLERSKVREILIGQPDENLHITEHILFEVDALPIFTAVDLAALSVTKR